MCAVVTSANVGLQRQFPQHASLLGNIRDSLSYPSTSMVSFKKLVAISLAAKLRLMSDSFGVRLLANSPATCHLASKAS